MPARCRRHDPGRAITLGHNPALLRQGPPAPRSCRDHLQPRDARHRRRLSHTPMSRTLSPLSQGGPPRTNTDNLTLVLLPARSPELNPVETIWQFLRQNWLSSRVFASYRDIVDHCCDAWNRLTDQPWLIMSIGLRDWANA